MGAYPSRLAEQRPLRACGGNRAAEPLLQLAAAAVGTAGDAITRYQATAASTDHGLYGGIARTSAEGGSLTLSNDELLPGVTVSGRVSLSSPGEAADGQLVSAELSASTPGLPVASLSAHWSTSGADAEALVSGSAAGDTLAGRMAAP